MQKHYHNDPVKTRSREIVRGMLERTLLEEKRASDVKVICLPGIDAQEVLEVYDPLGIPRSNITSLEIDPEIVGELKRKDLGMEVINQSAENYFDAIEGHEYDVVSLDFTGTASIETYKLLQDISKRQKKDRFALHMAHSMRRDPELISILSRFNAAEKTIVGKELILASPSTYVEGKENGELRDVHYTAFIMEGLMGGNRVDNDTSFFVFGEKALRRMVEEMKERYTLGEFGEFPIEAIEELGRARERKIAQYLSNRSRIPNESAEHLSKMMDGLLFRAAICRTGNYFNYSDIAKYSYISESGTPMNGDVAWLTKNVELDKVTSDFARSVGYPYKLHIQNFRKFVNAYTRAMSIDRGESLVKESECFNRMRHLPRQFLGNSSRPVLTKKRFLEEMDAGRDISYIQANYRGWQQKPLAQWQAHHTMGTYRTDMAEESPDDKDVTKISREQAIDMLKSGIPADEIYDAYPTSFTKGQLRAYRAHITMGSYQTEGSAA